MAGRKKQSSLFDEEKEEAYGGALANTRHGRARPRPLACRRTMHLVMRSSRAVGPWSFATRKNRPVVEALVQKFAKRHAVKILSLANVGNHLHIHLRLTNRFLYAGFIRALTAAITMAVTGHSRWNKVLGDKKFWDLRPFTRIVAAGKRAFLRVRDYVRVNQFEGFGASREEARLRVELERARRAGPAQDYG